jgi:hypothetical protein
VSLQHFDDAMAVLGQAAMRALAHGELLGCPFKGEFQQGLMLLFVEMVPSC